MASNTFNLPQNNYDATDHMQQMIQQTQKQLSKTKHELDEAVSVRSHTPILALRDIQQKDYEIEQLRNRVLFLEQQLGHQEREFASQLKDAQTMIRQQEATIRTQSRTIANPRPNKIESTPFRAPSEFTGGSFAHQLAGPPPVFSLPAGQGTRSETTTLRSIYGAVPPPQTQGAMLLSQQLGDPFQDHSVHRTPDHVMNATRFVATDDRGSPMPAVRLDSSDRCQTYRPTSSDRITNPYADNNRTSDVRGGNQRSITQHNSSSRRTLQGPAQTSSPAQLRMPGGVQQGPSTQLTPSTTSTIEPVVEAFNKVFDMAVRYGYIHVNFPSNYQDHKMPDHVKERLLRAATQHTAHGLISSQNTRYFLVGKIIIEWLVKHVLQEDTFRGLDRTIDEKINSSRSQIYQSTPAPVRYLFLNAIAQEFQKLTQNAEFSSHVIGLCNQRGHELFGIIQPMMHNQTPNQWEDLRDLIFQAHVLAQLMHTHMEEFRFEFPVFNAYFEASTMSNVDPGHVGMNEAQTIGHGRQIKLAAVPKVIARLTMADGQVVARTIIKASVLMK